MTKKIIPTFSLLLSLAVMLVGVTTVNASEVTGTLSSGTASDEASGSISGTVSDGSGGSSSSGGSRSSNGSNNDTPPGAVLGATTDAPSGTPGFPNAGTAPNAEPTTDPFWLVAVKFLKHVFTF